MTTYPPLMCSFPGCDQPRAKGRGTRLLYCQHHLDQHMLTCVEPGCLNPRYETKRARYSRCEQHAQQYWRERVNTYRTSTLLNPAPFTPRTKVTPSSASIPSQRLVVSIGDALPVPTAAEPRPVLRRLDWRRIACQRPRRTGVPRSHNVLPVYDRLRVVVANYVKQSVVTLDAAVLDEQPMSDLRRDLRAQLQTEAARGSLVIEFP